MVSVELKQEKHNALVSFLMIVIAALFLLYMGSSLVHSTKAFWENYSIEELLEQKEFKSNHYLCRQNILPMILYFTATGNSRWIAELLAEATHDTAVSIVDCLRQGPIPAGLMEADRLGIVFPVHSWYAPRVLIDFLSQLRLPDCCYRYAVCTCGDDMGKGILHSGRHL